MKQKNMPIQIKYAWIKKKHTHMDILPLSQLIFLACGSLQSNSIIFLCSLKISTLLPDGFLSALFPKILISATY